MEEKSWLRVETIARDLDVSEGTVRAWIRDGLLPAAKFRKEYRIRREDYQTFIQKHLNPGTTEENH
jgi:excisionase family DNA binding protein